MPKPSKPKRKFISIDVDDLRHAENELREIKEELEVLRDKAEVVVSQRAHISELTQRFDEVKREYADLQERSSNESMEHNDLVSEHHRVSKQLTLRDAQINVLIEALRMAMQ